jgi:phage tail-like protein
VDATRGSRYLNDAGTWTAFQRHQVDVIDGALQLAPEGGGFVTAGAFVGGPFEVVPEATPWFTVDAAPAAIPPGAHLQLFSAVVTAAPPVALAGANPFPGWAAAPRGAAEFVVPHGPGRRIWIGGVFRGNGAVTPVIRQVRVDYGPDPWLAFLPAIYGADRDSRDLLNRLLALCETTIGRQARTITDLTRLFDPAAAPAVGFPSWLQWLAGWLAFDTNGRWTEAETRAAIAEAFALHGWRGTIAGLKRQLKLHAGVEAHVTEAAAGMTLWTLGESSALGVQTRLAPAALGGAVLGSAVLDRSNLEPETARGASLFEDVAHHFCVEVSCADLRRPGALADVRRVIAREKPAHTVAGLRLIGPSMRVGVQARVGVDTVVAAGPPGPTLGQPLDGTTLARVDRACHEEVA